MREPLYSQLATRIENLISSGRWQGGEKLPPERELCKDLQVSRDTLRLALSELESRGLLNRHQGRGTFVRTPRVDMDLSRSFTISEALAELDIEVGTQVLEAEPVEATRQTATELAIAPGMPALRLRRLRTIGDEPLILEVAHLPMHLLPGATRATFEGRSLYHVLSEDFGLRATVAEESLEPAMMTTEEARILGLPPQSPGLLIHRVTRTADGTPIETNTAVLGGDKCRFLLTRRRELQVPQPGDAFASSAPAMARRAARVDLDPLLTGASLAGEDTR